MSRRRKSPTGLGIWIVAIVLILILLVVAGILSVDYPSIQLSIGGYENCREELQCWGPELQTYYGTSDGKTLCTCINTTSNEIVRSRE